MGRGRPKKASTVTSVSQTTLKCFNCKSEHNEKEFYSSNSKFFSSTGKIPYCKKCINEFYQYYCDKYEMENYVFPEKKAVKRICMVFDIYYSDKVFDSAIKELKRMPNMSVISSYMKVVHLSQHGDKSYDTTLQAEEQDGVTEAYANIKNNKKVDAKTVKFFGSGFSDDDYEFLQEQYDDWTTRHECQTKSQEEVFKRICFKQLEILKATRRGEDTKNLDATFQSLLETAKLQPKQNTKDAVSDAQVFGTLIDKWENTRPLPDIDEQLKDVDKIGLYIDVFFRGHLSKMMGIKNAFSNLYTKFIEKYTVNKPEYDTDDNSEVIFDAIFGNRDMD